MKDLWLPCGHALTDGAKIRSLLYAGDEWQIYDTTGSDNVLVAQLPLARKWIEEGRLAFDEGISD